MFAGIVARVAAGRLRPAVAAGMIVVIARRRRNGTLWTQLAARWLDSGVVTREQLGIDKDEGKGKGNGTNGKDKGMGVQNTLTKAQGKGKGNGPGKDTQPIVIWTVFGSGLRRDRAVNSPSGIFNSSQY